MSPRPLPLSVSYVLLSAPAVDASGPIAQSRVSATATPRHRANGKAESRSRALCIQRLRPWTNSAVRDAVQGLRHHTSAQVRTLLTVGWWGGVRPRIARFLANLWQGLRGSLHGSPWHGRRRHRPEPCPQPIGTSGAVLSSDNCGSSVERTAKLHPLWQTGTRQPVGCSMSACSRKTGRAPVR